MLQRVGTVAIGKSEKGAVWKSRLLHISRDPKD
jgi:hypothetical protein